MTEVTSDTIRKTVYEAFDASGNRVSDSDLRDYIRTSLPDSTAQAVGQTLRRMREEGIIALTGDVWRIQKVQPADIPVSPAAPLPAPQTNGNGRVQIADYYRARQGKTVEIIRGRKMYEDVFRVEYMEHGSDKWLKILTWVDPIIYIGEMMEVDPEQEVLMNVRKLKVTFTSGEYEVIDDINPRDYVTIAPASGD